MAQWLRVFTKLSDDTSITDFCDLHFEHLTVLTMFSKVESKIGKGKILQHVSLLLGIFPTEVGVSAIASNKHAN